METSSLQIKYRKDVLAFAEVVEQLGNPFNSSNNLIALHTQEIMENEVVMSIRQLQDFGKDLHGKFVSQIIEKASLPIKYTLKRQKVLTFANRPVHNKKRNQTCSVQSNSSHITKIFFVLSVSS